MTENTAPVRRLAAFAIAALAALALPSQASAEGAAGTLPDTSRLVTIGGSITEIAYALGAGDAIVARDSTSTFPQQAAALPDIGYMRQLSPEGVLSVDPTAILASDESGPPETIDVLKKAAVPLALVPETFTRQGVIDKIEKVGAALGKADEAEELANSVAAKIDRVEAGLDGIEKRKRVLFLLSVQGGRMLASGSGTAADGMIALAGGENAVTGFAGYKQLTDEAVIQARPDVILMMSRGGPGEIKAEDIFASPAIASTPAGEKHALVRMDGLYLLGFGPRTADAAHDLAAALYPDQLAQ